MRKHFDFQPKLSFVFETLKSTFHIFWSKVQVLLKFKRNRSSSCSVSRGFKQQLKYRHAFFQTISWAQSTLNLILPLKLNSDFSTFTINTFSIHSMWEREVFNLAFKTNMRTSSNKVFNRHEFFKCTPGLLLKNSYIFFKNTLYIFNQMRYWCWTHAFTSIGMVTYAIANAFHNEIASQI